MDTNDDLELFKQRLGKAKIRISELVAEGHTSPESLTSLQAQLDRLSYQINQLNSANADANEDLTSGLELSCADLERQLSEYSSA